MKTYTRAALVAICTFVTILSAGFPAGAADPAATLRAVSALPASSVYMRGFLAFVHDVNDWGKNKIWIELVNETVALDAISHGRLDMGFGPVTGHRKWVPEADAISASEIKAKELRANGGMALIDQIYRVRAKVRFLGMLNSGARLHIYLKTGPRMAGNLPNLADTKIAADEIYGGFLASLGAQPVSAEFSAALAVLQAGKADGIIWPRVGVLAAFRAKQLKYRIDPGFSQIVTGVVINLERWARLDRDTRELIDKTMLEHERKSYTAIRVETGKDDEALDMAGLSVLSIKGKDGDKYTARATHDAWSMLTKNHPSYAAQLEHVFYRERSPK